MPKRARRIVGVVELDVSPLARLFADPSRAAVIGVLMSGLAHSAGELAQSAGVSAPTMTGHLRRLLEAGAVEVRQQGRHRYYRLADPAVARAFEALAFASQTSPVTSLNDSRKRAALAEARSCYDHLAGRLGCELAEALLRRGALEPAPAGLRLTTVGAGVLERAAIDVEAARRGRRRFAYACLDWTERRDHLAGALGAAVLERALSGGWVERRTDSRALRITPLGETAFTNVFGLEGFGCN